MNSKDPNFNNAFSNPDPKDDNVIDSYTEKKPKLSRKVKIILISIGVFVLIFGIIPISIYGRASNSNPDIPFDSFESMNSFQFENAIYNSIINPEPNVEELTMRQSLLNSYIYSFIQTNVNELYNPTSQCDLENCQYLYHELNEDDEILIGVKAIWVEFEQDKIFINAAIDYNDVIRISTVARFEAELTYNIDRIKFEIVDFKLDKFNVPNFIVNQITESLSENLELQLPELFDPYINIDVPNLTATLKQSDLTPILEAPRVRIESIQIVEGGMVVLIRYGN